MLQFSWIHLAIGTNTFYNLDKYIFLPYLSKLNSWICRCRKPKLRRLRSRRTWPRSDWSFRRTFCSSGSVRGTWRRLSGSLRSKQRSTKYVETEAKIYFLVRLRTENILFSCRWRNCRQVGLPTARASSTSKPRSTSSPSQWPSSRRTPPTGGRNMRLVDVEIGVFSPYFFSTVKYSEVL